MVNDTVVTVRGYAGADPVVYDNGERGKVTQINVGCTPRLYSRSAKQFKDGSTTWYTVRCYGRLGKNAASSVRRGHPVLVRGRLSPQTWTDKDGHEHVRLTVLADSLGVELTTGIVAFTKTHEDGAASASVSEQANDTAESNEAEAQEPELVGAGRPAGVAASVASSSPTPEAKTPPF
ncbi:single-stranded DNA-binding protein [Neoactinobaculum massilliense]|uniref:single-stranded DNA-binding protein n=1 Tax=Neoactinobaculum massilliense TaxID=2364794 RepID=UPI000F5432B5|nr:single-stranded DNA-binding protein [Neoactinobaculum massilliense]